jgi:hypothetical protein
VKTRVTLLVADKPAVAPAPEQVIVYVYVPGVVSVIGTLSA